MTEEAAEVMVIVSGMAIELPDDRTVFVGRRDDDPGSYVFFRNGADELRFKLSAEAVDALLDLLALSAARGLAREYQIEMDVAPLGWEHLRGQDAD